MNKLLLIVLSAFIISAGCKTRKVSISKSDSTHKSQEAIKVVTEESKTDKSKSSEIKTTFKTDSSEVTTTITPAEGKIITVEKDGSFKGEAKSIVTVTKKAIKKKSDQKSDKEANVVTNLKKDSSSKKKEETIVVKKQKDVVATPDYSFIIYIAVGILVLFFGFLIYKKVTSSY